MTKKELETALAEAIAALKQANARLACSKRAPCELEQHAQTVNTKITGLTAHAQIVNSVPVIGARVERLDVNAAATRICMPQEPQLPPPMGGGGRPIRCWTICARVNAAIAVAVVAVDSTASVADGLPVILPGVTDEEIREARATLRRAIGRTPRPPRPTVANAAMLTVRDVCDELQIGRTKLYALIKAGSSIRIKLGKRSARFSRDEVDEMKRCSDGSDGKVRRVVGGVF